MEDLLGDEITAEEQAYFEQRGEPEQGEPEKAEPDKAEPEKTEQAEQAAESDLEKEKAEPEKTVDIRALHEARFENKALKEQLQGVQTQVQQLQSLKEELDQYRKSQQVQDDSQAYDDDPMGYLKNKLDQVTSAQTEQADSAEAQRQQQEQWQAFASQVSNLRQEFMAKQPDYADAYEYMMKERMKEFEVLGISDLSARQQQFDTEALALANYALQNNQNPAELVYRLAEHKGYRRAEQPQDSLQEKVEQLEKGQQAAHSLADTSSQPESGLSLANVEKMSDEEFDKLFAEYERAARDA
jgi:hypothetical protein